MTRLRTPVVLLPLSLLLTTVVSPPPGAGFAPRPSLPVVSADDVVPLNAQIVATGIPGAGAICQIGTFHLGGPFHDNAAFSPFTGPGEILDGRRLLVASSSGWFLQTLAIVIAVVSGVAATRGLQGAQRQLRSGGQD